ncbi:MAG: hypothetical protein K9L22_06605 [Methylococcaceae bacterium]|nr:hypothetical protein [Methylococcaceae bacterium]
MSILHDDVYRFFYDKEHITPKEMANLILGNDPREKSLLDKHLKSEVEKIIYYGKKINAGECDRHTNLTSKELFNWCITKFPEFKPNVPRHYVLEIQNIKHTTTVQNVALIRGLYDDLKEDYIIATNRIEAQSIEITALKQEIARLAVFEEKIINRKESSGKGGANSRGVKKTGV